MATKDTKQGTTTTTTTTKKTWYADDDTNWQTWWGEYIDQNKEQRT